MTKPSRARISVPSTAAPAAAVIRPLLEALWAHSSVTELSSVGVRPWRKQDYLRYEIHRKPRQGIFFPQKGTVSKIWSIRVINTQRGYVESLLGARFLEESSS